MSPGLRRTLGLWHVTFSGVGVILGAGVYALIAPAALRAGSALWLAFLIAALAAGFTAYAYARLGRMRPKDSPEFQYTALAFGPRVGFVAGWLMLVADLMAAAAVALGFGGYLAHLAGTPIVPNALGLVLGVAIVLFAGIGGSVALALVLTVVEAAGLVLVIAVGVPSWATTSYVEMPHGLTGVWEAAALIFFAYLGFDELGNLAEEMRAPERDLPRALGLAFGLTTGVYVCVALSAVAAVDWRELAASPAPLALVVRRVLGPGAEQVLSLMALAATANTVLLLLLSACRSVYGMAAAGQLPGRLARIGDRATPSLATWTVAGVAAALVLGGNLARAAAMTDAAVLVSFMLVNGSLVWIAARRAEPSLGRVLDVAVPAAGVVMCGALLLHLGWVSLAIALAIAVVGLLLGRAANR